MVTIDIPAYKHRLYKIYDRFFNGITKNHIPCFASNLKKEEPGDIVFALFPDLDDETSIYRKFSGLAARNLLYLQSELLALEKQLDELDMKESVSLYILEESATMWETLMQLSDNGNTEAQASMDLITKVRARLKEYQEALLLQRQILGLKKPHQGALDVYKRFFQRQYPKLNGQIKVILDGADDLAILNTPPETDYLSHFLKVYWTGRQMTHDGITMPAGRFNESRITAAVTIINVIVAVLELICPIPSLYFVTNDAVRLGLVAGFTTLFALSVGFMTNARRVEIFGATAAYAAVLVVFVSGNISNSSG